MDDKQQKMYDALKEQDSETVIRAFLDYHGNQLLDDGFLSHLEDEGILEATEEEEDEEEEEEEEEEDDY